MLIFYVNCARERAARGRIKAEFKAKFIIIIIIIIRACRLVSGADDHISWPPIPPQRSNGRPHKPERPGFHDRTGAEQRTSAKFGGRI
jgi:hypothetical protein